MPIKKYFKGKGRKVMKGMKERYGDEKGKEVFYATANKQDMNPKEAAMQIETFLDGYKEAASALSHGVLPEQNTEKQPGAVPQKKKPVGLPIKKEEQGTDVVAEKEGSAQHIQNTEHLFVLPGGQSSTMDVARSWLDMYKKGEVSMDDYRRRVNAENGKQAAQKEASENYCRRLIAALKH